MADKFVTFNAARATPTGLPQAVDTKINTRYATKGELQSAIIGTGGVVSSSVSKIVATTDPEYVPQPGELVLEYAPPFRAVDDFTNGLADWTGYWNPDSNWVVEDDVASPGGKKLQLIAGTGGQAALSWDLVPPEDAKDVEVLYRTRVSEISTTNHSGVNIRGSGDASSRNTYRVAIYAYGIAVGKFVADSYSNLAAPASTVGVAVGDAVWVRFRAEGNKISAKSWVDGTPEPAGWSVDVTDDSITGGGYVGPSASLNPAAPTSTWDIFAVALDGATAVIP